MEYLNKKDMRNSLDRFKKDKQVCKGMACLEKYIGHSIPWFHPQNTTVTLESGKRYAVIDEETKEVVYEADRLNDIAKEYCMKIANVSRYLNIGKLINERYVIVRCDNE